MHIEEFDGSDERIAIAACCLQTDVLAAVAQHAHEKPFANTWANLVFGWCLAHHKQFKEAPGGAALTSIFGEWSLSADKTTKALVEKFLTSLQPVQLNTEYCVELVERIITRNATKQMLDRAQAALSNGNLYHATDAIAKFKLPSFAEQSDYVEPLTQASVIADAFNKTKYESLIKYPEGSAIQRWLGPTLHRDALVSFIGPDKSGKSSHLAALAQRAVYQGLRVAFLNLGDLSQEQCLKRWSTAYVGRPSYACTYKMPESIKFEEGEVKVGFSERKAVAGYTEEEAIAAWAEISKRGETNRFRLVSRPARTFSVDDLYNKLESWANKGWVPDVVAIDYAGLLARSKGMETHEALDHNWAELRKISSTFKILLLTASQSKATGYTTRWLGMESFEGSKGINAHCNAVIGINIDQLERQQQVVRFNWIVLREQEYLLQLPSRHIAVAGCPNIGKFHLISEFI